MEKTFSTLEVLNICGWYKQAREKESKPLNALPLKIQWNLKKNINAFSTTADDFIALQKEMEDKLRNKYAVDEYSEETTNENGDLVRKVKDEYLEKFQSEIDDMNQKLNEILEEKVTVSLVPINVDAMLEELGDKDIDLDVDDLEILANFSEDNID